MTTVTSGRCVPPAYGAFSAKASPGCMSRPRRRRISCTDSPIEPRCTGMCGALAMSWPCASKSAQEKSRRSLMFTELAVFASVTPICSAMAMNRLLKISSNTGSARVDTDSRRVAAVRSSTRLSASVSVARHPRSTTTVVLRSQMTAGPAIASPGRSAPRSKNGVSTQAPSKNTGRVSMGASAPARGSKMRASPVMSGERPVAVTPMVSMTMARPGT